MLKPGLLVIAAAAAVSGSVWAQSAGKLPAVQPLLPQIQARAYQIDPAKGYVVKALKPGVFMITDGGYQAMFVPTGLGVVLFDAPFRAAL